MPREIRPLAPLFILVLLAAAGTPAAAQSEDGERRVHVEIHEVGHCDEGEDCDHDVKRHVFISKDGEHHVVGHGNDYTWVGANGEYKTVVVKGADHGSGYLGIGLTDLTEELRLHFGVPEEAGVMVSKVFEDSPAWEAGLRVGDIITAVDGDLVGSAASLARKVGSRKEGERLDLELYRDGRLESLSAVVEEKERALRMAHGFKVGCDEGEEDCLFDFTLAPHAEILVECEDGSCSCTVDGEEIACEALHHR